MEQEAASREATVAAGGGRMVRTGARVAMPSRTEPAPQMLALAEPMPLPAPDWRTPPASANPLQPVSAGIPACPEPHDGLRFEPSQGFVFDAAEQATAMMDWINHLRCLGGVTPVARDARIDAAADGHAAYSVEHGTNAHEQVPGRTAFTGVHPGDRIRAKRYVAATAGEVLSRTGPLAKDAYDGLVAAIYHRLVMLNPQFTDAGVSLRPAPDGMVVSVVEYGAPRAAGGQTLVAYPIDGQREVPVSFNTDVEIPDPAPDLGTTGYPISMQAARGTTLAVERFSLHRARDGDAVPARVHVGFDASGVDVSPDAALGRHESFLLPLSPLEPDTEYEVRFVARLDGQHVERAWRFRTQPQRPLAVAERERLPVGEWTRLKLSGCSARYWWSHSPGLELRLVTGNWMQVRGTQPGRALLELRDGCGRAQRLELRVS